MPNLFDTTPSLSKPFRCFHEQAPNVVENHVGIRRHGLKLAEASATLVETFPDLVEPAQVLVETSPSMVEVMPLLVQIRRSLLEDPPGTGRDELGRSDNRHGTSV